MHERECKGYISFNRGVNELNRGVNELNRGVNELNRGVNHSVARQGCNLLRAAVNSAVTSAVTSQGCCCGNLQIHPLDLGQAPFPVHELLLCYFAAYLAQKGLPPQTVKGYLAAVRSAQISMVLPDPREQSSLPLLRWVQAGISRIRLQSGRQMVRVRLPSHCPHPPEDS